MNGLPDVTLVKSTSGFGMGVIYVYFKDSVDIYFARQLVAERLRSAEAALPPNLPKPELGPISSGLGQIFIYYLQADRKVADTEGKELNSYLRELNDFVVKRQLQTVPGVTAILSMGGHVLQYQVQLNPELMRKYDVSYDDVVEAIDANNRNVGGQYIEIGAEEYLVRGIGMLKSLDDIRNLTVREIDGVPLKLGEIAKVEYGPDVRRGVVTRNGEEEVVAGIVLKLHGENTSRVIHALHEKLAEIGRGLPKGITIVPYYDQADLVDNASRTVENALFQGILLVLAVLAVALWNFRASLIVALSMPFCASLAIIGLNRAGLSANLMSLGGIAIALGMLVDGSIVVTENILRHLNRPENAGRDRLAVIAEASKEVGRPIAFALLIIIAVFIPIFLFEGVEGKMFKPLAFSIVVALAGSIVAAVVNAPVLASILFRSGKPGGGKAPELHRMFRGTLLRAAAGQGGPAPVCAVRAGAGAAGGQRLDAAFGGAGVHADTGGGQHHGHGRHGSVHRPDAGGAGGEEHRNHDPEASRSRRDRVAHRPPRGGQPSASGELRRNPGVAEAPGRPDRRSRGARPDRYGAAPRTAELSRRDAELLAADPELLRRTALRHPRLLRAEALRRKSGRAARKGRRDPQGDRRRSRAWWTSPSSRTTASPSCRSNSGTTRWPAWG